MRAVREVGQEPPLQLVFALRPCLHARQLALDGLLYGLVVTQLKMEVLELLVSSTAPVATKQTVTA